MDWGIIVKIGLVVLGALSLFPLFVGLAFLMDREQERTQAQWEREKATFREAGGRKDATQPEIVAWTKEQRKRERQGRPAKGLRLLWYWAYGVDADWIINNQWRNRNLFDRRPWHCIVCRREWIPGGGTFPLHMRYGYRDSEGIFYPYDDSVLGLYAGRRHHGWINAPFRLWWPNPGHARDCIRYAHGWHFRKPTGAKGALLGADCLTGEPMELRPARHGTIEALGYYGRWTLAKGLGLLRLFFLLFRIAWAWVWDRQPIPALRFMAYILDGLKGRIIKTYTPFGAALLWGRVGDYKRHFAAIEATYPMLRCRHEVMRFPRRVWRFVRRIPATWADTPWPWRRVDGAQYQIGVLEHWALWWEMAHPDTDECYFVSGGIHLPVSGDLSTHYRKGITHLDDGGPIPIPNFHSRETMINTGPIDEVAGVPCPPIRWAGDLPIAEIVLEKKAPPIQVPYYRYKNTPFIGETDHDD